MSIALLPTMATLPAKLGIFLNKPLVLGPQLVISTPKPQFYCYSTKNQITHNPTQGFSALTSDIDIPWERGDIWSTMAMYMFNLHIPFGIGGLSVVSYLLHQPVLDPQTKVLSLLFIQILELSGAVFLLRSTAKTEHELLTFFKSIMLGNERNWIFASAVGFGFLILLVFLTSAIADILFGTQDVNNPILKEILLTSNISKTACVLVYCLITPLLEEIIYRGFLLTSLASTMNWQKAVFYSSAVFSAAHFSGENFLQLFIIGCVLGCCYSWTGNLSSSIAVHSLYNALTLIVTLAS
ncbi:CAAX amino terminal protease family protein [Euphorbia peplus]|nr:CAAX amino terminal protease family protein [Euphorbia peplus]